MVRLKLHVVDPAGGLNVQKRVTNRKISLVASKLRFRGDYCQSDREGFVITHWVPKPVVAYYYSDPNSPRERAWVNEGTRRGLQAGLEQGREEGWRLQGWYGQQKRYKEMVDLDVLVRVRFVIRHGREVAVDCISMVCEAACTAASPSALRAVIRSRHWERDLDECGRNKNVITYAVGSRDSKTTLSRILPSQNSMAKGTAAKSRSKAAKPKPKGVTERNTHPGKLPGVQAPTRRTHEQVVEAESQEEVHRRRLAEIEVQKIAILATMELDAEEEAVRESNPVVKNVDSHNANFDAASDVDSPYIPPAEFTGQAAMSSDDDEMGSGVAYLDNLPQPSSPATRWTLSCEPNSRRKATALQFPTGLKIDWQKKMPAVNNKLAIGPSGSSGKKAAINTPLGGLTDDDGAAAHPFSVVGHGAGARGLVRKNDVRIKPPSHHMIFTCCAANSENRRLAGAETGLLRTYVGYSSRYSADTCTPPGCA
ncbi:hypothetical protein C8F04DRAFT_1193155 [Mycena alexandri]|uniref:Uncharacterized protein n=1 Tax=Mycena alexandri TaxID=1745969 RepID=A0AAD6WWJ0_9AGAR|nr:hypothetical protein C8F04DRAFT_1193155 [Mycena alexandri]